MPVVVVPGPLAPAPPPVTVEVPQGWEVLPAGADLLRVRGTGAAGDPVEVRLRPHTGPSGYAVEDLLEEVAATAAPGAEVEPPFVVEIAGREWAARNLSWDEPDGAVVEVHLATALASAGATPATDGAADREEGPAFARLLVATGRVRGAGVEPDYDTLQSVLESIVVGGDA